MSSNGALMDMTVTDLRPGDAGRSFFRRNVACVQLAFAAFWVVKGVASIGVGAAGLAVSIVGVVVSTLALCTKGVRLIGPLTRPDFAHPEVRRLTRRLSWATVVQLLGSTVIGAALSSVGWDAWVVPSLVTTIGLFLIYAGGDLAVGRTTKLGWVMTCFSVLPTLIFGGETSTSTTVLALGTAALLAASSAACFSVGRTE